MLANVTNWLCNTLEGERLFGFIECNALPRLQKSIGNGFRFDLWMYRFNDFQSNCCIRLPYEMKSSKTITSNHLLNNIENFSYSNDYYCCCLMGSGNRKYIIGFCLYQMCGSNDNNNKNNNQYEKPKWYFLEIAFDAPSDPWNGSV